MPFEPGQSGNIAGRPVGAVSKITKEIRGMIAAALERAGGEEYLVQQAAANPVAFLTLVGKIVPADVKVEFANPLMQLGADDIARLIVTFARNEGFAIPGSVKRITAQETGDVQAILETKDIP